MDVGKYCNSDTHYTYESMKSFQEKIDYYPLKYTIIFLDKV